MEANIMSPGRTTVAKATPSKLPMRFKTNLPDDYAEHHKFYMQLSDSDDDDVPERSPSKPLRRTVVATGKGAGTGGPKKGGAGAGKPEVHFKHERPVDRERPVSARMLHTVSANDSEFKVQFSRVTLNCIAACDLDLTHCPSSFPTGALSPHQLSSHAADARAGAVAGRA